MADAEFNTHDKNPIFGDSTITFRAFRFGFREILLGLVAAFLLVLCLLFAGLFGHSAVELKEAEVGRSRAENVCKNSMCLKTSGHLMELLNVSVSPCDNFHAFACGGYKVKNPVDRYSFGLDMLTQMAQVNEDRLMTILGAPSKKYIPWSAEKKLKDFYRSCTDDFTREQLKAKPLLDKIISKLGGWWVLNSSWNPSTWNLTAALMVVQTDFWVDAFYAPRVTWDDFGSRGRIISIFPGGAGRYMRWSDYTSTSTRSVKLQGDYKKFMTTVATLLARDAHVSDSRVTDRIGTFVDDAYEVESKIATFASNTRYSRDAFSHSQKVTLDQLKQSFPEIDWTMQLSYLFNEAGVTGSTKVVEPYPTYISNLTAMIRNLDSDQAVKNRKLNNYLMWRVLEVYVQDLSWEYMHANRQVYVDKYGPANFLGTQKYCFMLAKHYFDIALSSLYVYTNFEKKNKDKVTDITDTVKTAIEEMLTSNTWMDQGTKDYAIAKMKGSSYKIGYPEFMEDESKVDAMYAKLEINPKDFFSNLIACNQQHRREWNRRLLLGEDRTEWIFNAWTTNMAVYWYWDEVIAPAGILQFPMYTYDMPHYYTFGAIGSLFGQFIHHLIDDRGRRWDKGGVLMKAKNGWWSNQTTENFDKAAQCVANIYNNVTQGPYYSDNGNEVTVDVDGDKYAGKAMTITTGIRLAYNAYKAWQKTHGTDPYPPGLKYTPEQLFFIAHAQVFCYNRDPVWDYILTAFLRRSRVNEETRVNIPLQELPEFSQAFGCQASDNMVPDNRCTYY
ncbi:endothelin-converting enzyme homolog isoform X1 [Littorina saxatilis]|uniref:Uncharacterized protein n=1 Tax=Littorina saxatilis TaxID=31220 RepID=A0AAN9G8G6_9CAEN